MQLINHSFVFYANVLICIETGFRERNQAPKRNGKIIDKLISLFQEAPEIFKWHRNVVRSQMSGSSLTGVEVATITTVAMTREVVTTIISTATDPQRSSAYKRTTAITSLGMLSDWSFWNFDDSHAFVIFTMYFACSSVKYDLFQMLHKHLYLREDFLAEFALLKNRKSHLVNWNSSCRVLRANQANVLKK